MTNEHGYGSVQSILNDDLGMRRVCAKKNVPRPNGKLAKRIVAELSERPTDENGVFAERKRLHSHKNGGPKITCRQITIEGQG